MIGDSLLNHIAEPDGFIISNEAGATLLKSTQLFDKAAARLCCEPEPATVIVQLGTNDVVYNKESATKTIDNYTEMLVNIKNRFPQAKIGLCSIPPCKGSGVEISKCNDTATVVNAFLESSSKISSGELVYINPWSALWSNKKKQAISKYYTSEDKKGVHLNKSGKASLMKAIFSGLAYTSSKRKSSNTLSPVNKLYKGPKIDSSAEIQSSVSSTSSQT